MKLLLNNLFNNQFRQRVVSMASTVEAHYANRKSNGVYDSLHESVSTSGTSFLANCEYNKNFFRKTTWSSGYEYQDQDGSEFKVNIFGEIQPAQLGTKNSALGDFYTGTTSNVSICYGPFSQLSQHSSRVI